MDEVKEKVPVNVESAGTQEKKERSPEEGAKTEIRRDLRGGRPETGSAPSEERGQRRTYFRRKVCKLCVKKTRSLDYKDVDLLRRFVTERGKILPRRITGTCARHQRMVSKAIRRARIAALLPFVQK